MTLQFKTKLRLKNTPEAQALAEIMMLEFPAGEFKISRGGDSYRLEMDIHAPVTLQQKALFLDLMRTMEEHLVETVFVRGQLGNELIHGYLGPEREQKEVSRACLNQIRKQIQDLLPEHRDMLRALLSDN